MNFNQIAEHLTLKLDPHGCGMDIDELAIELEGIFGNKTARLKTSCCDCGLLTDNPMSNGDDRTRCEQCAVRKYLGDYPHITLPFTVGFYTITKEKRLA